MTENEQSLTKKKMKKVKKKDRMEKDETEQQNSKHNVEGDDDKKRKRKSNKDDKEGKSSTLASIDTSETKGEKKTKLDKDDRKAKKAKKKAEKEELMNKVPKKDENGISYTKVQIKRMMKRVKRGLDPVPTEEEERQRIRQLKLDKREEEDELAGLFYKKAARHEEKGSDDDEESDDNNGNNEDDDDGGGDEQGNNNSDNDDDNEDDDDDENDYPKVESIERPRKKPRSKAVPSDYTCMACNNKHEPLHWIYDCPDKIYKPGANKLKKKLRGIHDPASRKVFISGLPFDAKTKDVEIYFEKEMKCGKIVQCKLLQFEDTKRCKGTGFLTFETDEGAKNALKLNGTVLSLPESKDDKKKKNSSNSSSEKKELRLGVKKLLNRTITKRVNK